MLKKNILILTLQYILPKNIYQVNGVSKYGFFYTFLVKEARLEGLPENAEVKYQKNGILRLIVALLMMIKKRRSIHHVEVYPGGKLTAFFVIFAKLLKLKSVIVERGDLQFLSNSHWIWQTLNKWAYINASVVWYKEPYMEDLLKKIGVKELFFLNNAISLPDKINSKKNFLFIWCNRVIPSRRSDWFINVLNLEIFKDSKNILIGIKQTSKEKDVIELQQYIIESKQENLKCLPFSDPTEYLKQAKFFVFPSEKVFANFALLESMGHGVVPIVSNVEGTERIVKDGVNGIVFEHNYEAFKEALFRANSLSEAEYEKLSKQARKTIEQDFSIESYAKKLNDFYQLL